MKKLRKILFITFGFIFCVFLLLGGLPTFYSADPIVGVVRDSSNLQPVPGAIVIARWTLWGGSFFHSNNLGDLGVQIAVADSSGKYVIPGWRLKFSSKFIAAMPSSEPKIYVYKYGYVPATMINGLYFHGAIKNNHSFFIHWYGSTDINVNPLIGSVENKIAIFDRAEYYLPPIYKDCGNNEFLPFFLELDKQLQEKEIYLSNIYNDKKWLSPWFQQQSLQGEPVCLNIKNTLINARKKRH